MTNLEILKDGYRKFAAGDMEGAVANWATDIEWNECKGFPFVKNNGVYIGVPAIIEGVLGQIPVYYDDFGIEIADFVDGGDKVVMVGWYTGVWKATGKKFKANVSHTWYFENGKAVRFIQAADSAEIINPA